MCRRHEQLKYSRYSFFLSPFLSFSDLAPFGLSYPGIDFTAYEYIISSCCVDGRRN